MFKRFAAAAVVSISLAASSLTVLGAARGSGQIFDRRGLENGVIGVSLDSTTEVRHKFMVQKEDKTYYYNLQDGDVFPLQFGNGEYTVAVFENVTGNKYRQVAKETLLLEMDNPEDVFLESMKLVNWDKKMKAIKKAGELTKDAKTNHEKVLAVYSYIINNVSYDDGKMDRVGTEYVPVIDETFTTGTGMCYDFASLFAAMLRSEGVPVKLVMGYKNDIEAYHAWNQVYLDGGWVTVDTTYDSILNHNGEAGFSWDKDDEEYSVEKVY